jgi:hypothetical protein
MSNPRQCGAPRRAYVPDFQGCPPCSCAALSRPIGQVYRLAIRYLSIMTIQTEAGIVNVECDLAAMGETGLIRRTDHDFCAELSTIEVCETTIVDNNESQSPPGFSSDFRQISRWHRW